MRSARALSPVSLEVPSRGREVPALLPRPVFASGAGIMVGDGQLSGGRSDSAK